MVPVRYVAAATMTHSVRAPSAGPLRGLTPPPLTGERVAGLWGGWSSKCWTVRLSSIQQRFCVNYDDWLACCSKNCMDAGRGWHRLGPYGTSSAHGTEVGG